MNSEIDERERIEETGVERKRWEERRGEEGKKRAGNWNMREEKI